MIWALVIGMTALAVAAQVYKVQRDYFAEEVLRQYAWIDDIIKELESDE